MQKLASIAEIEPKKFLEDIHCTVIGSEDYSIDTPVADSFLKTIALNFQNICEIVIPTYVHSEQFENEFPKGNFIAYQAILDSFPSIDNKKMDWDQVIQIRQDSSSIKKLRDLRLWLETGLKADSITHAKELIDQKLNDYTDTLKKHGVFTFNGILYIKC